MRDAAMIESTGRPWRRRANDGRVAPVSVTPTTDPARGLDSAEAARRRAAGLANEFRVPTSRTTWEILRDNSYPLINGPLLLVTAALVSFSAYPEALITGLPVIGNIAIGVIQGMRAKRQLDRVALLARTMTRVVRDGQELEIPPEAVVLGDVVIARRGDEIQLDGRILGPDRAAVDESALTGESDAIEKVTGDPVQSGSVVVRGTARFEVEAVGADTFANRILIKAKGRRDVETPLQADIRRAFVGVAALIALVAVVTVLTLDVGGGAAGQHDAVFAAAVLVTLVPQGLALMLTVTYAAATVRLSRLGALAQRSSAIEAMSRIDTFLTDKTGTLSTQRIQFGSVEPVGRTVVPVAMRELLAAVAAGTGAPSPTTLALRAAFPGTQIPVLDEVAFSSALRWSAIRFASDTGSHPAEGGTFVLGAPAVLAPSLAEGSDEVMLRARTRAATGDRVLLFARGSGDAVLDPSGSAGVPGPLEALALLTFTEELRPDAEATIDGLRASGIDVKIVSGDDPDTVAAVGRRLGLEAGSPVSGLDLAALDDDRLAEIADRTTLFGRVDPELKARIVAVLKGRGRYVAMTGDGVNDILPVRTANVGVAMSSGSPATRGVADLVLLEDDFSIVPEAIRDGQRIVTAMAATLTLLLARTFYVLMIIAGAALVGLPFPLTPRENSILALVTVGIPVLVFAAWVEPRPSRPYLLPLTLRTSVPLSIGLAAVSLPVYAGAITGGATPEVARTILTTLTTFLGIGAIPLIPIAAVKRGAIRVAGQLRAAALVAALAAGYVVVLATEPGRAFFELEALPAELVVALAAIAATWTGVVLVLHRLGTVQMGIDVLLAHRLRSVRLQRTIGRIVPGKRAAAFDTN